MKAGWTYKNLADLCTFFGDGDWIESKDQSSNGIRLIQTGNVGEGVFKDRGDKARYINEETFDRLRCTEIFEGDCLISRLPDPVGRSSILPDTGERMITAVDCTIVRFNHELCLPEFFNYYSQSIEYINNISERCTGTTRNRISRSQLGNTPIPTPDVGEQRRIVTLLDEAFADIATAKANSEKNLHNARALFESHLDASFGRQNKSWTEKALQDIGSTQTGSTPKTSDQANYGDELPFIKPGDFAPDGTLNYENDGLSAQGAASARKVSANAVLMVCIGATIGKCGYAEQEIATNQQINAFTPNVGVDKKFIYYQMLTKRFQDCVIHSSGQATLPIINKSKWSALTIYLPGTLGEQEAIAKKMDFVREETQRLEYIYRQKLTALEDLKKSLLHQAFSGQL